MRNIVARSLRKISQAVTEEYQATLYRRLKKAWHVRKLVRFDPAMEDARMKEEFGNRESIFKANKEKRRKKKEAKEKKHGKKD